MVTIRLKVDVKDSELNDMVSKVKRLIKRGINRVGQSRIRGHIKRYWRDNVYRYYNRRLNAGLAVTGQLGNACEVSGNGKEIKINMKPIYSSRPSGTYDYGKFLRRDVGASTGVYVWEWDARSKWLIHKGARNYSKRWKPWINDLAQEIERFLNKEVDSIIEDEFE